MTSELTYWLSTSMLGVPTLMALHSVGMAFVVGLTLVIALRLNRLLPGLKRQHLPRFLNIAAWGFHLNLLTGIGIFVTRPMDYLTSALFLFKLLLVVISVALLVWMKRRPELTMSDVEAGVADTTIRLVAILATALLFGTVIAGRLLAYLSDLY